MKKSGTIARVTEMSKCDFCLNVAEYYCKTKMGMWVYMCKTHFEILGTGKGQKKRQASQRNLPELVETYRRITKGSEQATTG